MKRLKQVLWIVIIILITLGMYGCSNEETEFKEQITKFLEEKYGSAFEVLTVTKEFIGNNGTYIHAGCEAKTIEDGLFDVYCYSNDDNKAEEFISVGGATFAIYEKFGQIYLAHMLERELGAELGEENIVKCQIQLDTTMALHYSMKKEDLDAGIKYCLDSKKWLSYVSIYVISESGTDIDKIREKTELYCLNHNAYRQYLYFVDIPDLNTAKLHYKENRENYDEHIKGCEKIQSILFAGMRRDEGIVKREELIS